jgi:hypothetical protein
MKMRNSEFKKISFSVIAGSRLIHAIKFIIGLSGVVRETNISKFSEPENNGARNSLNSDSELWISISNVGNEPSLTTVDLWEHNYSFEVFQSRIDSMFARL